MNRIIPILCLFLIIVSCEEQKSELDPTIRLFDSSEVSSAHLTDFLNQQIDSLEIPGLSIAIINDAKVVYSKNIGYANLDTKKELTEN
ncbi:MAG: hypothetical protein AAGA43_10480 [Bacteroidota bacterium]